MLINRPSGKSAGLRAALGWRKGRELLSLLPDEIVGTAVDSILNTATGHVENLPILSVAFSRQTLKRLNTEHLDPSDTMKNFLNNMSFKKTTGFSPVQRVELPQSVVST